MILSLRQLLCLTYLTLAIAASSATPAAASPGHDYKAPRPWSKKRADRWSQKTGWLIGANYNNASASNQLEMWQADTFDPDEIDTELGWAEDLGFNSMRVYLHDLLWKQDAQGLLERMEQFLEIADSHGMGVMFVLLDGVWDPYPQLGPQLAPTPYVHNSRWLQSPGAEILGDPSRYSELKPYIKGVIRHFRTDPRIHAWDLFNEPDNPNQLSYGPVELPDKQERATQLLAKVFKWARKARPKQPKTAGVWQGNWSNPDTLRPIDRLSLEHSDVITFHFYGAISGFELRVDNLRRYDRPILCTEYMARVFGSTFDPILGYMNAEGVSGYNWGLVSGKTQTIYSWTTWVTPATEEPALWFHDILRPDGTAYDQSEVDYIRGITLP